MKSPGSHELAVLSWGGQWDRALRRAVSAPFEAKTGIRVRHEPYVGLDLPDRLLAPLYAGRFPPVAVVWSNAVTAMRAAHEDLCDPLRVEETPNLAVLHPRARPHGFAGWPVVMVYAVLYVLVYRRAVFADHVPDSWQVLLDSRHRGKVALYPHGNGIHAVAQLLGGGSVADIPADMTECWHFLRRLAPQVRTLDYSVEMTESLRRGDLDLCFRALPNALGFRAAGVDVDWVAPREGVPDTMDAFWIPRHLPRTAAERARQYIDFALSTPIQEQWCGMLGTIPVHPDSAAPEVLRRRARVPYTLNDADRLLYVPDSVKLEWEHEWRRQFAGIFNERNAGPSSA